MSLETFIPQLPENWPTLPAHELQALADTAPRADHVAAKPQRRVLLEKADTLRALALLLVVMLHVLGAAPVNALHVPANSPWRYPFELFDLLRMPLFVALAGILYGAVPATAQKFPDFLRGRALSLLLPGVVVSLIYFGLHAALGQHQVALTDALLRGYLHLWFLYALFAIMVVVGAVDTLFRPGTRGWIILLAGLIVVAPQLPWVDAFELSEAVWLAPFFVLGLVLYRDPASLNSRALLGVMAVIAAVGILKRTDDFTGFLGLPDLRGVPIESFASVALILLAARYIPRIRPIEALGLYSYAIYLWHPFFNAALRTTLQHLGMTARGPLFLFGTVAGVFLPIALYKIIERGPRPLGLALIGK